MEKYKIIEAIGEGSFGRVFRGECKLTGQIVALKFITKRNKVDRELKSLRRECEIQQGLFHPNIVRMTDSFETDREVVAVSEYVPVQLFSILEKFGRLPEQKVRQIACNLVSAIYYLHSLRILHRDIKPQNILLTLEGVAKLCDFGFSRKMGINTYVLTSIKGTPLYMAPELIEESPYDHTADLWSLGCILFELITGKPPFNTTSIVQLIKMVRLDPIKWPENIHLSANCCSFLKGLLQKEPNHRLTWPALLQHPWIKDGVILLNDSLDNPLTSPLSSSQQQIKELQKQQLLDQTMSQPKILKNITQKCFPQARHIGAPQTLLTDIPVIQQSGNCILAAPELNATNKKNTDAVQKRNRLISAMPNLRNNSYLKIYNTPQEVTSPEDIEMKTMAQTNFNMERKQSLSSNADVRAGVGSSVRKLSTISQESGFKDEDVADFRQGGPKHLEGRKDSMVNFLSSSANSSHQESRPSFPNQENNPQNLLPNIDEEAIDSLEKEVASLIVSEDKMIEEEEWSRFLDKTLVEVLENNLDVFMQDTELSMFLSPLQSPSCPAVVIEKVLSLLTMPFVLCTRKSK